MQTLFHYCYFFCYQLSVKGGKLDPKGNAVYGLLIIFILLELLLLILITSLIRLFFQLPKADNPIINIAISVLGNAFLWNWLNKYFSMYHKQIVKNRFQPIHTSATVDSLIYVGIVIAIISLIAVVTFSFPRHL